MIWTNYLNMLNEALNLLEANTSEQTPLSVEQAFKLWHDHSVSVRNKGGFVYLIGNGASAAMSSHFAADLFKNGGIRTHVFTDSAVLTAIGNDIAYNEVYAYPIERYCTPADMLIAISSSGMSPNILLATEAAKKNNTFIVTLSGFSGKNRLRETGNVNFYIPSSLYGITETCHAAILHHWMDNIAQ